MRKLLLILAFFLSLFAADEPKNVAPKPEVEDIASARQMTLAVLGVPKEVVENQVFVATLRANTNQKIGFEVELKLNLAGAVLLNENAELSEVAQGVFEAQIWLMMPRAGKVGSASVTLRRNGEFFESKSVAFPNPRVVSYATAKGYSNLVADELVVTSLKTRQLDVENNIVLVNLRGKNVNINTFKLNGVEKQGVNFVRGNTNKQSGQVFLVVPRSQTDVEFTYFDLAKKSLSNLNLKINVEELGDNANTDLNPQEGGVEFYKRVTAGVLGTLFALAAGLLAFFRRKRLKMAGESFGHVSEAGVAETGGAEKSTAEKSEKSNLANLAGGDGAAKAKKSKNKKAANLSSTENSTKTAKKGFKWIVIFAVLSLICWGYVVFSRTSFEQMNLAEKSVVRILPMESSNIFFIADKSVEVDVLNRVGSFTKIKLGNKIGWTKNENLR